MIIDHRRDDLIDAVSLSLAPAIFRGCGQREVRLRFSSFLPVNQ